MRRLFWLLVLGVFLPVTSYAATISGTVLDQSTGLAVANATISVNGNAGNYASAQSDASGQYTITDLNPDTYSIYATTGSGGAAINPTTLAIVSPTDALVVNFGLAPAGTISGVVTANDTLAGLFNLTVCAQFNRATGFCTQTDAAGQYVIGGLPAASYKVKAADDSLSYVTEFYDNVPIGGSATQLNVVAGGNISGIDFGLDRAGTISGTVSDNTGTVLPGMQVSATSLATGKVYSATTDASGHYVVQGLPGGDYQIQVGGANYPSVDYNNGAPVTVGAGVDTSNINLELSPVGTISGTVTDALTGQPIANAYVNAYSPSDGSGSSAQTDANGHYVISGLTSGSYQMEANSPGYVVTYFNNITNSNSATLVTVVAGADTSNINFGLAHEGTISGTVTGNDTGQPLGNVQVVAYLTTNMNWGGAVIPMPTASMLSMDCRRVTIR